MRMPKSQSPQTWETRGGTEFYLGVIIKFGLGSRMLCREGGVGSLCLFSQGLFNHCSCEWPESNHDD